MTAGPSQDHTVLSISPDTAEVDVDQAGNSPLLNRDNNSPVSGHLTTSQYHGSESITGPLEDEEDEVGHPTLYTKPTSFTERFYGKQNDLLNRLRTPPSWAWCAVMMSLAISLVLFISGISLLHSAANASSMNSFGIDEKSTEYLMSLLNNISNSVIDDDDIVKEAINQTLAEHNQTDVPPKDPLEGQRYLLEDYMSGRLTPHYTKIQWHKGDTDGMIILEWDDHIILEFVGNNTQRILAKRSNIRDPDGQPIGSAPFTVSADLEYIMFATQIRKKWRHSSQAEYIIYRVADESTFRLTQSGKTGTTSYAEWSPVGHSVMFVRNNDLYVSDNLKKEIRITFDGSATIFNGVPDWVYEEEIYGTDHVCWWSPDGRHIAFLRLDVSKIPEYRMPMYAEKPPEKSSYPTEVRIRYPKPGYWNPIATLHVFSLDGKPPSQFSPVPPIIYQADRDFVDSDRLIVEVAWMGNTKLLLRVMNRHQDIARLHLVYVTSNFATFGREYSGKLDGGWLDIRSSLTYVPATPNNPEGYIDVMPNAGFDHLAFYSPIDSELPLIWLTSGDWEVVDGPLALDVDKGLVYYMSTERGSTQRHLYSAQLDGLNRTALTPDDGGFYSASFSPKAGWYLLNYQGPNLPRQTLFSTHNPKFSRVINDFADLRERVAKYKLPKIRYTTVKSEGHDLNAVEILPPDFDPSKKYGVLFRVYGGPSSQLVKREFRYGFEAAVVSDPKHQMISVTVDNRGTGFKGRPFRIAVRRQLGTLETIDQINAGRYWSQLSYVDPKRIVIWGWSYGGYMAAKVIEANSSIFSGGMSVAPVTNWYYYDSVYTERYMLMPQHNPTGYAKSAITDPTGFHHAHYLVIHGTGDDNVHFQQTATLVNLLTENQVNPDLYEVQFYTDNDHSMGQHNAYLSIWRKLTGFLLRHFPVTPSEQ